MEVAYGFQSLYKFAITTDLPAVDDLVGYDEKEESQVWILHCKEATGNDPCLATRYYESVDIVSLARLARALQTKPIHDISEDGNENPYLQHNMHFATIFYDDQSKTEVKNIAKELAAIYRGSIAILLVDVKVENAKDYGHFEQVRIPRMSVTPRGGRSVNMDVELTLKAADRFLAVELGFSKFGQPQKFPSSFERKKSLTDEGDISAVEEEDDQIAEAVNRMKKIPMDRTHIPALTDKTFETKTKNSDILVVLYYLTFDTRIMAFMRSYIDVSKVFAEENKEPLAAVDCYDWTDVCGKNNITSYPSIWIYRKNKEPMKYEGMLDSETLINSIKLLMLDNVTYLSTQGDASKFAAGDLPEGISEISSVSILGLFTSGHKQELALFKQVAKKLSWKFPFGYTSEQVSKQMSSKYNAKSPSIVVIRRQDVLEPFSTLDLDSNLDPLQEKIIQAAHTTFPELTVYNFPSLFQRKQPFTILFDENIEPGKGTHEVIQSVVKDGKARDNIFCWMDLTKGDGIAGKILLEYNSGADPPALAQVNHAKNTIHNYNLGPITKEKITQWLEAIERGTIPHSKQLREGNWKPLNPGYDFLKIMDEEKKGEEVVDDEGEYQEYPLDEDAILEQEAREELYKFRRDNAIRKPDASAQQPPKHVEQSPKHTEL